MNVNLRDDQPTPGGSPWCRGCFGYVFHDHPVAAFLVAFTLVLVTAPLDEAYRDGDLVESLRLTVLFALGFVAMGGRRRSLFSSVVLMVLALVGKWVFHFWPSLIPAWSYQLPALLFVALMIVQLLKFILEARQVNSEVLCAGLSGYLLLGFLWAFGYMITAQFSPGAFMLNGAAAPAAAMRGFTAIYFSFITLCTIGYGDIVPASGVARMLTIAEGITGTFYMAVMISRLVSLYSAPVIPPPPSNPA